METLFCRMLTPHVFYFDIDDRKSSLWCLTWLRTSMKGGETPTTRVSCTGICHMAAEQRGVSLPVKCGTHRRTSSRRTVSSVVTGGNRNTDPGLTVWLPPADNFRFSVKFSLMSVPENAACCRRRKAEGGRWSSLNSKQRPYLCLHGFTQLRNKFVSVCLLLTHPTLKAGRAAPSPGFSQWDQGAHGLSLHTGSAEDDRVTGPAGLHRHRGVWRRRRRGAGGSTWGVLDPTYTSVPPLDLLRTFSQGLHTGGWVLRAGVCFLKNCT